MTNSSLLVERVSIGEIFELREDLNSMKEDKKKEAVKKVIAAMTIGTKRTLAFSTFLLLYCREAANKHLIVMQNLGKDVSALFTEVLNCIQTNNLELKKLVYLYIMNYAKTQPDRAILAVNTFQNVRRQSFLLVMLVSVATTEI